MSTKRPVVLATLGLVAVGVAAAPSSATFSGSDGKISFAQFVPESETVEIFTANPDGTSIQQITETGKRNRASFLSDWSPNGDLIAFDSDRVDQDGRGAVVQVYVMNADGTGVEQITHGRGFHGAPGYSPDGQSLAIDADWGSDANNGIWIVPTNDPNGVRVDEADRVTDVPGNAEFDSEPQFSPDGESIAFTRFQNERRSAIFTVDPDGTNLEQLTSFALNASDPDWSPNGEMITFDSGDGGVPGKKGDIFVMKGNGTGQQRLTDAPPNPPDALTAAQNPVWSPSGTQIMFTKFLPTFKTKLVVMDADGSNKTGIHTSDNFPNKVDWGTHPLDP
jgi:Tol biopolymer transport system component